MSSQKILFSGSSKILPGASLASSGNNGVALTNCRLKQFPDGTMQAFVRTDDFTKLNQILDRNGETGCTNPDMELANCRRAREKIFDLARSNTWDYFLTLTFDPAKVDRYSWQALKKPMASFVQYLSRRHGCRYLFVPELHKDGAYHIHGLTGGGDLSLVPAVNPHSGQPIIQNGSQIYNIPGYKLGFATASEVISQARVSTYLTKYTTKDLLRSVPSGSRRYWASRSLAEPVEERLCLSDDQIQQMISSADFISGYCDNFGNPILQLELSDPNLFS